MSGQIFFLNTKKAFISQIQEYLANFSSISISMITILHLKVKTKMKNFRYIFYHRIVALLDVKIQTKKVLDPIDQFFSN